jgi:hypothetical protein
MQINQEQVTWSLLIVVFGLLVLPVTSCEEQRETERTKKVQIMSAHCATQGKTFKAESTAYSEGMCI